MAKVYWRNTQHTVKKEDERWALYDSDNYTEITPYIYKDYLSIIDNVTTAEREDGVWGVLDTSGNVIIPFVYDYLFYFHDVNNNIKDQVNGISAAQYKGKWGFINLKNEAVIPLIYDEIQTSELNNLGEYIIAKLDGKYGMINRAGETLVPFEYDGMGFERVKGFTALNANINGEYLLIVMESGTDDDYAKPAGIMESGTDDYVQPAGIIEPGGVIRQYLQTEGLYLFNRGEQDLVWVVDAETGLLTYLKTDGTRLIPPTYDSRMKMSFRDGMAMVLKDGKIGFIDSTGRLAVPLRYDFSFNKEGKAIIERWALSNDELSSTPALKPFIRPTGLLIPIEPIEFDYPVVMGISPSQLEEMRRAKIWIQKYGENGSKADGVGEFAAGLAMVGIKGKFGYIDKAGEYFITPQYEAATAFRQFDRGKRKSSWVAAVKKNGKWALIGPDGKQITKFKYADHYEAFKRY